MAGAVRDARHARERGELEREVVAHLAAIRSAATPAEVQRALPGDLAYTTVMTTLSRLHAKGVLRRRRAGRAFAYEFAGRPEDAGSSLTANRMRRLLDSDDDRAGVLSRFVADLGPEDEAVLAELLREQDRR